MNKEIEEQDSIIHKIDILNKYPKLIELCFKEYQSKSKGVMMCIIGILEGSDEPRLNCYYLPDDKVDQNIIKKIEDNTDRDNNNLIFYVSDTKFSKVITIKINDLSKYLNKE